MRSKIKVYKLIFRFKFKTRNKKPKLAISAIAQKVIGVLRLYFRKLDLIEWEWVEINGDDQ